jgi:hypothetical protein
MKILHYSNEVKNNIKTIYTVNGSDCKYTLNHPLNLIIDAEFIGKKSNYANSQGWERDSNKYFKELYEMHPEYFSDSNKVRIMNNKAPIVNEKFLKYFPEYVDYKTQILVLHHIGGDGQMVAIPQDIHSKGFGEIHNVEKSLGIRDIAIEFSNQVENRIDNGEFESGKRVTYYYDSLKERNLINDDENKEEISKKEENQCSQVEKINSKYNWKSIDSQLDIGEMAKKVGIAFLGASIVAVLTYAVKKGIAQICDVDNNDNLLRDDIADSDIVVNNEENLENQAKDIKCDVNSIVIEEVNHHNYPEERAPMPLHDTNRYLGRRGKNKIWTWISGYKSGGNNYEEITEDE